MKKYSNDIAKLYENVGFDKIETGKTYLNSKGNKITINNIYIDATNMVAEALVNFDFETNEGEKSSNTAKFSEVVEIIRLK